MSTSAPQIGMSFIAPSSQGISASSSSSSSFNKYDPVRMGSEDCIRRIKQTAKVINAQIPPSTYTRCHEMLQGYHLVVGGFAPGGLYVPSLHYDDDERIGVAGLRKF